ncbi:MAG: hypothetical protein ACJ78X_08945, partial [Myxococcales bacterium]
VAAEVLFVDEAVHQPPQRLLRLLLVEIPREMGYGNVHSFRGGAHFQSGLLRVVHRLLEEEDATLAREARQQVLRALEDEVPAQMGKTKQVRQ